MKAYLQTQFRKEKNTVISFLLGSWIELKAVAKASAWKLREPRKKRSLDLFEDW